MSGPAPSSETSRIVCLSNVFDQHYHDLRDEPIERCLSASKRRDLYKCFEMATQREVIVLSSPPRAAQRRRARWLGPVQTNFSTHPHYLCGNWDAPKIRVPLSWWFYLWHVLHHTRNGDIVLIDNYELIYIFAARFARLFRRLSFVLDYEDGKHLIAKSWDALFTRLAEKWGRSLFRAALLAHPALGSRLAASVPTELVPGFVVPNARAQPKESGPVRLLYSGSLDYTRGVDLLLQALPLLPADGWHLHISGAGPLRAEVSAFAAKPEWSNKVTVHGALSADAYSKLLERCHMGINAQRGSDPIAGVTFPSKVFTYLSAGLLVVSSTASEVKTVCGKGCHYYSEESREALAAALNEAVNGFEGLQRSIDLSEVFDRYSIEGTARRIAKLFERARLTN